MKAYWKFLVCFAVLSLLVLAGSAAFASSARSKSEYCRATKDPASFQAQAEDPRGRLAFANNGGLRNGGVCWWHSLFQRSATYLTVFRPELGRPDAQAARRLILDLVNQRKVVEIPGYPDLASFSADWRAEIQRSLDDWQKVDGLVKQEWVRNMTRKTWASPTDLHRRMEELQRETRDYHRIPWVMLKLPGIDAHAWLVLSAARAGDGYDLKVIDSNYPGSTGTEHYRDGDRSISSASGNTVPYLGHSEFFGRVQDAMRAYCGR